SQESSSLLFSRSSIHSLNASNYPDLAILCNLDNLAHQTTPLNRNTDRPLNPVQIDVYRFTHAIHFAHTATEHTASTTSIS
ncbi:MAG: hypothetical protein OSB73_01175, partial [Candidatus Latescibacteria bacterium]|nr:hypothetical protein [Candidatus Latescibacterota bacterium]